jgi:hypothetical protein
LYRCNLPFGRLSLETRSGDCRIELRHFGGASAALDQGTIGARDFQLGPSVFESCLSGRRIDIGEELALSHPIAFMNSHTGHGNRRLGPHLYVVEGLNFPVGCKELNQAGAADPGGWRFSYFGRTQVKPESGGEK